MEFFHIQSFSDYSDNHHHHRHSIKAPKVMQKFERGTKRKRKRKECIEGDNSEEAIQVRAKRGQATDRHSLAERVRRKKINERLECLKTLVPGCYETMGMAVMLDAVISYLQSLQNQIEFLSMKLLAASMHYELHTPSTKSNCTTQMASTVHDLVQEIDEKIEREGSGYFHNVH